MARTWTSSQQDAIRLRGKTLLVSAAAGSGKTSVLTERIIRRLLDSEHPVDISRLLVVTFTRAAAAELKSRIGDALADAMAEHPKSVHLAKQMLALGNAQISTIDSFFQKIVKKHFEQLALPAAFRMADASELIPLQNEILDGILSDFYIRRRGDAPHGSTPLAEIRVNRFASVLDHLMSNRSDGKLNDTLLQFYRKFTPYAEGIRILHENAQALRRDATVDFCNAQIGSFLCRELTEDFSYYRRELEQFANAILSNTDDRNICGGMLEDDLAYCHAVQEALESKEWSRVDAAVRAFIPGRFSNSKKKSDTVKQYQLWRKEIFRKELEDYCDLLERTPPALLPERMLETAELFETLYAIYSEYETRLLAEKNERGILDFDDVRRALCKLLSAKDGTPTSLAEELSSSYDEVYIDEYQDVDEVQDRIFSLIGGSRRFMVGDIKQSIYGFRGSDPSIFAGYRRRMPLYSRDSDNGSDEFCIFMSENFRCNRPVIDFSNQVCAFLFSSCEESIGYRPEDDLRFSKGNAEDTPAHPVQVVSFEEKPRGHSSDGTEDTEEVLEPSEETRFLIDEIRRLTQSEVLDNGNGIRPENIAILVRTRKKVLTITKALRAAKIPAVADTPANPLEDPLLMDVLNLLRAIDNPYRDLPLSEALISPICDFTLEELNRIRLAAPEEKSLYDAMQSFAVAEKDTPLGSRLLDWTATLDRWAELASVLPIDRFLRILYQEEKLAPYAKEPALLLLYDKARTYQGSGFCGLYGFLDRFVKQAESRDSSLEGFVGETSAVKVMTIHHSKGLEFPVVFVAGCGGHSNAEEKKSSLFFHRTVGSAAKLYHPQKNEVEKNLLQETVLRARMREEAKEALRVLYVALTRARERLYVSGTVSKNYTQKLPFILASRPRSILNAGCDLYRVLAALQNSPHREGLLYRHIHYAYGTYLSPEISPIEEPLPSLVPTEAPSAEEIPHHGSAHRYREVVRNAASFVYPLSYLQSLPTKAAASRLSAFLQKDTEEDDRAQNERLLALMNAPQPPFDSLLMDRKTPTAAEIGTATHAFLQFCDFARLHECGIDREMERLLEQHYLTPTAAAILRREHLEAFLHSNLMGWLIHAKGVRREQKFTLTLPLSDLVELPPDAAHSETHELLVQGSIDLVIQAPDGRLILVDYKTDSISPEERKNPSLLQTRFAEAHGTQLACYAIAIEQLYGKRPDAICIYSLPLGQAIEIAVDPKKLKKS